MALPQRWLTLAVVSVALLLVVIDMTVLYTALPTLAQALGINASQKLWILNAYSLVMAGLMPVMGALGDRVGHRKTLLMGMSVFGAASMMAAYSSSPEILIAARVLLGFGAAAMIPATIAIVRISFSEPQEFAIAMGIWASVASGGAAFGPLVGGLLLQYFWWGSVFLINVPIIVIALIYISYCVPNRTGNSAVRIDVPSALLSILGIIALIYGIKEFAKADALFSLAIASSVLGIVALVIFVQRQVRIDNPLLDFRIVREPTIAVGLLVALVAAITLIGFELVLSQRLQLVLGKTPLEAGLYILPVSLGSFFVGPLAGYIIGHLGTVRVMIMGLSLIIIGLWGYYFSPLDSFWWPVLFLALAGIGMGTGMTSSSALVMSNISEESAGMVGSLEGFSYEFGGSVGVTIFGSIMMVVYMNVMQASPFLGYGTSLDEAYVYVQQHPEAMAMLDAAKQAFERSFTWVCFISINGLILLTLYVALVRKTLMRKTHI